jgi:hypothetical protein
MIGNDVVDLADPETGTVHPRFDGRVFASHERAAIASSGSPHRMRWLLWAAKEAAYKVARKLDPQAAFRPRRFRVEPDSRCVLWEPDGIGFCLEFEFGPDWVHAIVRSSETGGRVVWAVGAVDGGLPGKAVRALALTTLAPTLGTTKTQISIVREGRIPRVYREGEALAVDLSLSHHGRFAAFAAELRCEPDGRQRR